MNPTNPQLTQIKRRLQNMVKCAACLQLFDFTPDTIQTRPVEGFPEVEEVGVVCSHCGNWPKNVVYLNPQLKQMQRELKANPGRELRRQYQREFNRFQGKMTKKVNERINAANPVS